MKKKEEEQELVFGQRFNKPQREVTMKDFEPEKSKPKKMHAIEKANRARFGDAHVDKLNKIIPTVDPSLVKRKVYGKNF